MTKILNTNSAADKLKLNIKASVIFLIAIMCITGAIFSTVYAQDDAGHETLSQPMSESQAEVSKMALLAAAIAFGTGAVAAGFAISHVGSAAMGAVAEKPEIGGQALIFIALAEGLVVFGFITALMILGKV